MIASTSSQNQLSLHQIAQSPNMDDKLQLIQYISNLNLSEFQVVQSQEDIICAIKILMEDKENAVLGKLYNGLIKICLKHPFLRKIVVKLLERNIWVLPRFPDSAKMLLANLIRKFKECEDEFLSAMENQIIFSTRFEMIHFLEKFNIYSERFYDFHNDTLLQIWLIDGNKESHFRNMEQLDTSFNFNGFLVYLFKVYRSGTKIYESDIIKYLEQKKSEKEQVKTIAKSLTKLFEMVNIEKFSSTLVQVQKTFSEEILKKCCEQFTEDVRKGTSRCDEERFMCKIEVLTLKYSNVVVTSCLLKRIGILGSESEEMKKRFAMTLIRVSYEQSSLRLQNDPIVISYISKYTATIIPIKNFYSFVVSLKHAKLAINLIYYFVDLRSNIQMRNDLSTFSFILQRFVNATHHPMAMQMAEEVISDIQIVFKTKTRGQKFKPCVPHYHTVFNSEHVKSFFAHDYFVARLDGEFIGRLVEDYE